MLRSHKSNNIRYTKDNGEVTTRTIIPTFVPYQNIKAIDVTNLQSAEIAQIETMLQEYSRYLEVGQARLFSLEDWIDHTAANVPPALKWRTFKLDNIEEL